MAFDAIIIGGGAAGLFCAIEAGKRGRKVLVIEHNAEVGRKIIISGGGRCNFTNLHTRPENFISQNLHFCKSALSRYTPQDFISLVKKHKITFYEKKLGQLFCRESSRLIVTMLLDECAKARVEIETNCSVKSVNRPPANEAVAGLNRFFLQTNRGEYSCENLVVACGGLSFPKIGASDLGYRLARQFGLKIVNTRPSLVALVLEGRSYKELAGVSVDSFVSVGKHGFRENILFTHRGLSGPAILQTSNYWTKQEPVSINVMPEVNAAEVLAVSRDSNQRLSNFLARYLPRRFAETFAKHNSINKRLSQMNDRDIAEIGQALNNWQLYFDETEGYGRAEVTLGGVSTDELSSRTMEAKKVAGLYFVGEVVDVTGWLGGYNFQWAWASGFAAGQTV